jgi:predicted nucleic-acid-binding protein
VKALDTNVIVRFLLNDDKSQGRKARRLLQDAETSGDRLLITRPVVLESIWVLSAVYEFTRDEILRALELLLQMPVLEFDDYDAMQQLVRLGRTTRADLSDLLIGLASKACGCEATVTFEKGLGATGLFERL